MAARSGARRSRGREPGTAHVIRSSVLKVELHTHTADDPRDVIPYTSAELIDRAAELGFQALAITLHDKQLDLRWLRGYAADRGVVLIPGIERTIEGKHVLLLNFTSGADSVRTFVDLQRLKARQRGGLVIAPHPYFPGTSCLGRLLDDHAALFDAVEWNAMFTRRINFNVRAARWAARHAKPMVGNGDVHRLSQLGTTWSLVDAEPDAGAICRAIAAGRVRVDAHPISFITAATTMGSLLIEDLRSGSWGGSVRLETGPAKAAIRLRSGRP
jgi:predicted metal-dependent phosphoesterase TrpH